MSWFLMVAAGIGLLWTMRRTPPIVDSILIRAAAASFAGAGMVGANGWFGRMLESILGWIVSLVDRLSSAAVGTAVAWIIVAAVGFAWVAALLPAMLIRYDYPAWLVFSGLVLPGLMKAVPGEAGNFLDWVITSCGEILVSWVGGAF